MTFAVFLLLLGILPASQAVCELKDNARDLLSVDYTGFSEEQSEVTVYVDEITIKMKEGERWSSLLKDTSRSSGCNVRRQKMNVYYKKKTDEDWENLGRKRMTSSDDFEIRHLNPCETYEVKVASLSTEDTVGIFEVGPYYRKDFNQEYLVDEDNEYYLTYADSASNYINVTGFERDATIDLANLCAKTVAVHVYKDDINNGNETIVSTDLETKTKQSTTMEGLEPCTQYHVALDLFLKEHLDANHSESEDFLVQDIVSFYTMPDSNLLKSDLYSRYSEADNVLTWDFKEFFTQDCADDDNLVSTEFTLDIGGDITSVSEEGTQDLPSHECDITEVELKVMYGKGAWKEEVTAFNRTIAETNTVQDTLTLDSGNIVKTLNPCEEAEVEVTAESATFDGSLPDTITFPGDVASPQPVSEVEWQGCSDHNVTMRRGGRVVAEMVIQHPGWDKVLTVLEEQNKTATNITFKQPKDKCEAGKFKIEIVCKAVGSEEEVSKEELSEEELSENGVSEMEVSEGESFEEKVSEEEVSEEELSEGGVSENVVSEGEASEEKVSEEDVSEKEVSKREVSEEDMPEGEVSNESEEVMNESEVVSNQSEEVSNESEEATNESEEETNESEEATNENEEATNESEEATNENEVVFNESEEATNESEEATNENEVVSNESEEATNESEEVSNENKEVTEEFEFDDVLQVTNLTPETEYECKSRVVNIEEGGEAGWTEPVRVTTAKEEVEEEVFVTEPDNSDYEASATAEDEMVKPVVEDEVVKPVVKDEMEDNAMAISNVAAFRPEETEDDAISEESQEKVQEPRKAGASGLIMGLIVCGLLSVLLVAMFVTWRKRSNAKNYQVEEALPEDNQTDCVKVEINRSMTTDEPTEILTPITTPQKDNDDVKDPTEEVKITVESSDEGTANSDSSTTNNEESKKPVDEMPPPPYEMSGVETVEVVEVVS